MDHDRLFKELLGTFFLDFLRLFVPDLAGKIVEASLVPLDKEVFTDVTAGARHEVDLLVQAKLKTQPSLFLIHVETQASRQRDFAKRMFKYFARLTEKHDQPIYPIALFTYDSPRRTEPDTFQVTIAERAILRFHFEAIQLNQLSWRDFRDTPNPVASAFMAKMGVAPEERARVKYECYRMLVKLRLDPARLGMISGFIDAYLALSLGEEAQFMAEVAAAEPQEREVIMEFTNSWIEKGREEGRRREAELTIRLFIKRLGSLSPAQEATIRELPVERLEALVEAVFEIESPADLDSRLFSR